MKMLNKNEKGLSKLLETLQRYEEIRDSISVAVKEHGYQEYTNSDDDEIIMISKPGGVKSSCVSGYDQANYRSQQPHGKQ